MRKRLACLALDTQELVTAHLALSRCIVGTQLTVEGLRRVGVHARTHSNVLKFSVLQAPVGLGVFAFLGAPLKQPNLAHKSAPVHPNGVGVDLHARTWVQPSAIEGAAQFGRRHSRRCHAVE